MLRPRIFAIGIRMAKEEAIQLEGTGTEVLPMCSTVTGGRAAEIICMTSCATSTTRGSYSTQAGGLIE